MVVIHLNFNYSVGESCDELPTSLVYLDTSVNPHKLLGHVKVNKFDVESCLLVFKADEENAVEFDLGKF